MEPGSGKNIWIAAGDGDLERVRELVEQHGISSNAPDQFTYTPMHAAASYGHINILEYLISKGGDVNVTDSDGDTPLYTVESLEIARYLVDRGANVDIRNIEDISPAQHLLEDFPEISSYLESIAPTATTTTTQLNGANGAEPPSIQHASMQDSQNAASDELTSTLMASAQDILQRAEAEGRDAEPELRDLVERTVFEGVLRGYDMSEADGGGGGENQEAGDQQR
ncbi:ankyrin [Rickenella mellea]|uniref:Ankyrin n=1 Tax=Rickenella mellea TaxID=50990 RepID=A0A4Y7PX23_9AGAM|nr:ankyrin [Rickenella mellea]